MVPPHPGSRDVLVRGEHSMDAEALLGIEQLGTPSPIKRPGNPLAGNGTRYDTFFGPASSGGQVLQAASHPNDRGWGQGLAGGSGAAGHGGSGMDDRGASFERMGEEQRLRVLEEEWRKVQAVHDSVSQLKADLEMGKLPQEPADRRRMMTRRMETLQHKLEVVEGEARMLRDNCRETHRLKAAAEASLDAMDVEYGRAVEASQMNLRLAEERIRGLEEACAAQGLKMAGEAGREAERESEAARREEEMQARLEALERMLRGQGEALQVQQQLCLEQRERAERLEGELADASMSREAASVGVGSLSLLMLEDAARGRQVAELSARLADAVREAEEAGEGRERERRAAGRERERAEDLVGKLREEGKVRSFQARRVAKLEADMKAARAEERALIETVEQERMRAAQLSVQLEKLKASRPPAPSPPRKLPPPADPGGPERRRGEDVGRLKEEIARLREEVVSLKGRLERSKRQTDANRASMELWTSMNAGAGGEGGGGDFSLNLSSASSRGARGGRATAVALSAGEEEMDKLRGKVRQLSSHAEVLEQRLNEDGWVREALELDAEKGWKGMAALEDKVTMLEERAASLAECNEGLATRLAASERHKEALHAIVDAAKMEGEGQGEGGEGGEAGMGKVLLQRRLDEAGQKTEELEQRLEAAEVDRAAMQGRLQEAEERSRQAAQRVKQAEEWAEALLREAEEARDGVKAVLEQRLREAEDKFRLLDQRLGETAKDEAAMQEHVTQAEGRALDERGRRGKEESEAQERLLLERRLEEAQRMCEELELGLRDAEEERMLTEERCNVVSEEKEQLEKQVDEAERGRAAAEKLARALQEQGSQADVAREEELVGFRRRAGELARVAEERETRLRLAERAGQEQTSKLEGVLKQNKELASKLERALREKEKVASELEEAVETHEVLGGYLEKASMLLSAVEGRLGLAAQGKELLEERTRRAEEDNVMLKQLLTKAERDIADAEEMVKSSNAKQDELRARLSKAMKELAARHTDAMESASGDKNSLERELRKAKEDLAALKRELEEAKSVQIIEAARVSSLEHKLRDATEEQGLTMRRLKFSEADRDALEKKIILAEKRAETVTASRDNLAAQADVTASRDNLAAQADVNACEIAFENNVKKLELGSSWSTGSKNRPGDFLSPGRSRRPVKGIFYSPNVSPFPPASKSTPVVCLPDPFVGVPPSEGGQMALEQVETLALNAMLPKSLRLSDDEDEEDVIKRQMALNAKLMQRRRDSLLGSFGSARDLGKWGAVVEEQEEKEVHHDVADKDDDGQDDGGQDEHDKDDFEELRWGQEHGGQLDEGPGQEQQGIPGDDLVEWRRTKKMEEVLYKRKIRAHVAKEYGTELSASQEFGPSEKLPGDGSGCSSPDESFVPSLGSKLLKDLSMEGELLKDLSMEIERTESSGEIERNREERLAFFKRETMEMEDEIMRQHKGKDLHELIASRTSHLTSADNSPLLLSEQQRRPIRDMFRDLQKPLLRDGMPRVVSAQPAGGERPSTLSKSMDCMPHALVNAKHEDDWVPVGDKEKKAMRKWPRMNTPQEGISPAAAGRDSQYTSGKLNHSSSLSWPAEDTEAAEELQGQRSSNRMRSVPEAAMSESIGSSSCNPSSPHSKWDSKSFESLRRGNSSSSLESTNIDSPLLQFKAHVQPSLATRSRGNVQSSIANEEAGAKGGGTSSDESDDDGGMRRSKRGEGAASLGELRKSINKHFVWN